MFDFLGKTECGVRYGGVAHEFWRLGGREEKVVYTVRLGSRAVLAVIVSIFGFGAFAGSAQAEFKFCNKTSYVLRAAVAYEDSDWVSKGWKTLMPGKCAEVVSGNLRQDTYYTYAESVSGHKGGIKYFAGTEPFCLGTKNDFSIEGRDNCGESGHLEGKFVAVDVSGEKSWTTTFTEPKKFNQKMAQIAGVQRLLADIGLDPGRIDGELGEKTRQAIAAFKRARGITVGGLVSEELFAALSKEVASGGDDLGYKFCNQTQERVWAAIGFQKKSEWISRGWWAIEPGDCAKVIKDALTEQNYYVHALVDRQDGEHILSGGQQELCTAEVKFDIKGREDCEVRGYTSAGFGKVETGKSKSWTQTFRPQ